MFFNPNNFIPDYLFWEKKCSITIEWLDLIFQASIFWVMKTFLIKFKKKTTTKKNNIFFKY